MKNDNKEAKEKKSKKEDDGNCFKANKIWIDVNNIRIGKEKILPFTKNGNGKPMRSTTEVRIWWRDYFNDLSNFEVDEEVEVSCLLDGRE